MTRPYVRQADVDEIGRTLDDVDRSLISAIAQLRLISAQQLARLVLPQDPSDSDQRRHRYRLRRLRDDRILDRLPRRVGGTSAGSASYIYRLGPVGHRLVQATGSQNRSWRPSDGFQRHTLAVSECFVQLREEERSGGLSLLRFDAEPASWREMITPGGGVERLKPDAAVVLRAHGYEAHWYLEVDRGTESGPALRSKLERYIRYFETGMDQERLGLFPQVRFLITLAGTPSLQTDDQRVEQIGRLLKALPAPAQRLFTVHRLDQLLDRVRAGPTG